VATSVGYFIRVLIGKDAFLAPTLVVIATALITEYFGTLSAIPSELLLSGLASMLRTCAGVFAQILVASIL